MIIGGAIRRTYATSRLSDPWKSFKGPRWAVAVTTAAAGSAIYFKWRQSEARELSPEYFTPYRISFKEDIDRSHFLLELTPVVEQQQNLWAKLGCEKLWSVEIKQPEVMVVRNYTPLPLQMNKDNKSLEILQDGEHAGGKLLFYIKQYEQGEVARWLHRLPENHIVELRGPFIDYEFPHYKSEIKRDRSFLRSNGSDDEGKEETFIFQPFDIAMFTAGTGVVTALQLLLTENPFRGTIDLFYSCHSYDELGPLGTILRTLERSNRVRLHVIESRNRSSRAENLKIISKSILPPSPYTGQVPYKGKKSSILEPVLSLVCGPEGYVAAIAGPKYEPAQGPVLGLLEKKQWTSDNVYKLS
ncbi:hypothetical protein HG536_0A06540 [Torulaspora globosa]|uniref:FAD-binding FR-type domain-containing protein n=1 Tax=Torulaspora globosa TaxID=48254 RepID=A0A7G3ZBF3_9SACH|nr:uncharacterized protein HG536_0A06540 [Torulaspora globosa]QLL30839.1 hypothetical protein HG536_0A06540 [Torulaspora globosa]